MTCDVEENDTVDTLKAKVQKLEGEALIQCINKFAEGTLEFTAQKKSMTYEEAGVNITAGDDLVDSIKVCPPPSAPRRSPSARRPTDLVASAPSVASEVSSA